MVVVRGRPTLSYSTATFCVLLFLIPFLVAAARAPTPHLEKFSTIINILLYPLKFVYETRIKEIVIKTFIEDCVKATRLRKNKFES